ncbi:MAG: hypothetical protein COB53_03420 [Elusimicrobia bacterium]|nr:MAG: hypothetical protein COB53_03420 [Elusimicrobiota bacterium]
MVVSRIIAAVLSLGVLSAVAGAQENKKKFKPTDFKILSQARERGKVTKADFDLLSEGAQKQYLTLDTESIKIEKLSEKEAEGIKPASQIGLPTPPSGKPLPLPTFPGGSSGGGEDTLRTIDRIINIGKKIWEVIKENKPVVDVKTDYATAVPDGITHWSQLATWKMPKGTAYRLTAKNGYGFNAVNLTFMVTRTWGGSYKGKGQFLHGVAVEPLKRDVSWGYTLNMNASVPSTVNSGTSEDPIAAMSLVLDWTIKTVLKESGGRGVYWVQGNGEFNDIGARASLGMSSAGERARKAIKGLQLSSTF